MKLISLKVNSDFRNLKGLKLSLSEQNDTYVLIGNNGTGKTNILEALSSIFSSLLLKTPFEFSFSLRYRIGDDSFKVEHDISNGNTEYKKNSVVVTEGEIVYPNRIICNYSGEDTRLWDNYYKKPYNDYIKNIKQRIAYDTLKMVFGFLDGDWAGRKSMHEIIKCPDKGAKEWEVKKFGKAKKSGEVWFSFYPVWKGKKNAENFNVEDYFTCQLFRKYIFSFSSLDTIKGKDGLKSKLEDECKKGKIATKFFEKFSTLFDHIKLIKEAEANGLTSI